MNQKYLVISIILLVFGSCKKQKEIGSLSENISQNSISDNQLNFDFLPLSTTNKIIKHEFFTLSYNEKYEQAEWVAYELKSSMLLKNHFERPFFIEDPLVGTNSADWKNYKKSGYDKGHLCPAGDMKFSKKAFDDTFFTSNISPQKHDFNDGVWNRLEEKVRYWAKKNKSIYVITGGILKEGLKSIGKENVAIPEFFYKVLLHNDNGNYKMITFLVPSQKSDLPLYKFVIATDELERMTGIDFYPKLPDNIENKLEKNSDYKDWSF